MNTIKNKSIYGTVLIILFWYIMHTLINSAIIPSPHRTVYTFIKLLPNVLLDHLLISLYRITVAVIISLVLGVGIGIAVGMNKRFDDLISPVIYIFYPMPKVAFLPVFMILFGLGNLAKILLILFIIIFQMIVMTRDAVKSMSGELFYSVRSLGMNKVQIYRHLILPAILPKIITSLRLSVGTSVAVLFFVENFATKYGIGYFIMNSWIMVNYVEMFSGILALSLLGLGLFKLIDLLEDKFCQWIIIEKEKI
jgi:NitT/TauT family transport system permease protein